MFNPQPAFSDADERFMRRALELAAQAGDAGEVPIGAVVVLDGSAAGEGANRTRRDGIVHAHAELVALAEAEQRLGDYRLDDAVVYVTVEPCLMCIGAIHQARVRRVVYGVAEPKFGALGSRFDLAGHEALRRITIEGGLLAGEAEALLGGFFSRLRESKRNGL